MQERLFSRIYKNHSVETDPRAAPTASRIQIGSSSVPVPRMTMLYQIFLHGYKTQSFYFSQKQTWKSQNSNLNNTNQAIEALTLA